jgi:hypothetical protein
MANITKALIMLASKDAVGDGFFKVATAALREGLGCRWAGISYLSDDRKSIRNIAVAGVDHPFLTTRVPLEGIPAQTLYANSTSPTVEISAGLADRYPAFAAKLGHGDFRYCASLFCGIDGQPAGHVFVLDELSNNWGEEAWDFFTLVAERVGAEFVQRGGFAKTAWLDTLLDETGTGSVVIPIDID